MTIIITMIVRVRGRMNACLRERKKVEMAMKNIGDGKIALVMGGEHSMTETKV